MLLAASCFNKNFLRQSQAAYRSGYMQGIVLGSLGVALLHCMYVVLARTINIYTVYIVFLQRGSSEALNRGTFEM